MDAACGPRCADGKLLSGVPRLLERSCAENTRLAGVRTGIRRMALEKTADRYARAQAKCFT